MSDLRHDVVHAIRALRRRPGLVVIGAATLALGIGATTAVFSVVDTLVLRELPFPEADRLLTVWQDNRRDGNPRDDVAPANFLDWRERSRSFTTLAAAVPYSLDLVGPDRAEVLFGTQVTEGFFELLGIEPHLGRLLEAQDHVPGTGLVVLLGYGLWIDRFGGDSSIVGRVLTLDDAPTEVIGVLPPEFELALVNHVSARDIWMPYRFDTWERETRGSAWWNVVGRLAAGVTLGQAQADMNRVARDLATEYPGTNAEMGITVVSLHDHLVGNAGRMLWLLLGAVGLVLFIACANVAGLFLARGAEREAELGVRAALGASRARLARLALSEATLLAALGAAGGLVVAFWGVDLIKALSPGLSIARLDSVSVDARVLGFTLIVATLTALVAGAAPALQWTRPDLQAHLKEGRGTAAQSRTRARKVLIGAQTALALALLIGAGLLMRSFATLLLEDPGFRRDHLAAIQVFRWNNDESAAERATFFRQALERIAALPGVRSAGAVSAAPFLEANIDIRENLYVEGEVHGRPEEQPQAYFTTATPGYFETVGVPLLAGRLFDARDENPQAELVAVINQTMRRRFWGAEDPVGRRIRLESDTAPPLRIVGIVGDVRHEGFNASARPEVFVPHGRTQFGSMTFFVRTSVPPREVVEPAKGVLWTLDPRQTVYHASTIDQMVSRVVAPQRFTLVLLAAFAVLAVVLAAVGIYGVVNFAVQRRTREVGIRMALGARAGDVVGLLVRQGLLAAGIGVAVGLVAALAGAGLLGSMLHRVSPRDAITFAAAALLLLGVAAGASYLPARRAARVDPTEALRHE